MEHGTTMTLPYNVAFIDRMMTGLRFQNSGSWASLGKSHQ